MPGYLFTPDLLAVNIMIKKARTSIVSRRREREPRGASERLPGCKYVGGWGVPKATAILTKKSSPNLHSSKTHILNGSKFISGNARARDKYESVCEWARG